jgi:ApaG protein
VSSSEAVTRGIRVHVQSRFLPERSSPEARQWLYLYTVRIANHGDQTVQLLSRHWVITDASGRIEEVRGPGVVGEQPVLEPGEGFEYTSACPLTTSFGVMHGSYEMVTPAGERFEVEIAPFALGEPEVVH